MKILAAGGFFHDLNFTYYDTEAELIYSLEEERFSGIKSHSLLNERIKTNYDSLAYLRDNKCIGLDQIDYLVISDKILPSCIEDLRSLCSKAEIVCIGHYLSHFGNVLAFHSRAISGNTALLALDGFGDGYSGSSGYIDNGKPSIKQNFSSKDSLGLLYTGATQHLGLGGFGSEGKLQGLAAYGTYREEYSVRKFFSKDQGTFSIDEELVSKDDFACQELYAVQAIASNKYFGRIIERRFSDEPLIQDHMDFAATIQQDIFDIVFYLCDYLKNDGIESLVFSGGLAQNSTLVNNLYSKGIFENIYTTSSCSDRGNSLGALFCFLQNMNIPFPRITPFLGVDVAESFSDFRPITVKTCDLVAEHLSAGKVIALVDGRAELGARALCNRSILASPVSPHMKDRLNKSVKHRESFRPFAPVVTNSLFSKYFHGKAERCEHMTQCVPVRQETIEAYPSAVHVDLTSRVQSLNPVSDRSISKIIDSCISNHGLEVLLNTSLNDNGMPIVNNFDQALSCLKGMDIDYLVCGDTLIENN